MARQYISSGHPWEEILGYTLAVRVGDHVAVNATAATDGHGNTAGLGDAAAQARRILEIIEPALVEAGATLGDVIRTRVMLVNIDDWEAVGSVHGEVFGAIRPASLMFQVGRFINPEWLVEIEADAVVEPRDDV